MLVLEGHFLNKYKKVDKTKIEYRVLVLEGQV